MVDERRIAGIVHTFDQREWVKEQIAKGRFIEKYEQPLFFRYPYEIISWVVGKEFKIMPPQCVTPRYKIENKRLILESPSFQLEEWCGLRNSLDYLNHSLLEGRTQLKELEIKIELLKKELQEVKLKKKQAANLFLK